MTATTAVNNDDISSLRALVSDVLEKQGVLGKIKAQLRSSVFSVLEETNAKKGNARPANPKLDALRSSPQGRAALHMVRDFLQKMDLTYTLAVFEPEANMSDPLDQNEMKAFVPSKSNGNGDETSPYLMQLLNQKQSSSTQQQMDIGKSLNLRATAAAPKPAGTFITSPSPIEKPFGLPNPAGLPPVTRVPPPTTALPTPPPPLPLLKVEKIADSTFLKSPTDFRDDQERSLSPRSPLSPGRRKSNPDDDEFLGSRDLKNHRSLSGSLNQMAENVNDSDLLIARMEEDIPEDFESDFEAEDDGEDLSSMSERPVGFRITCGGASV
ncbi:hypothetical protein DFS34DRAFT_596270 [Phlyctochytrium arcticum]|nr:hypothetical protein DFS34DRAFT_596270 [Phlyctochytrium arcticum]